MGSIKEESFGGAFIPQCHDNNYCWSENRTDKLAVQAGAPHLIRVKIPSQHRTRMHFWRNLPTAPTYCALTGATQGVFWLPKVHPFGWRSNVWCRHITNGWSEQVGGQSKLQQLKCTRCKHQLPHNNCLLVQIHSLLHTICHRTCRSTYRLGILHHFWVSWVPNAHGPIQRCIFQDWKSDLTISYHLVDSGLESAKH